MQPELKNMLLLFVWTNKRGFKRQAFFELSPERIGARFIGRHKAKAFRHVNKLVGR
jgi:hypothetical protein